MNKVVEATAYQSRIYFEYFDYRQIPEKILDYLIKNYVEIYRKEYGVLFCFKSNCDDDEWKAFYKWMTDLEIMDDYKYISIDENDEDDSCGCSDIFYLEIRKQVLHRDDTDINPNPCDFKATVLKDHDCFDMKVKKRGI